MRHAWRRVKWHRLLLLLFDALMINLVLLLSLWLRFDGDIPGIWWGFYARTAMAVTPLLLIFAYALGLNNRVWEYARSEAVVTVVLTVTLAVAIGAAISWWLAPLPYSRGVIIMTCGFGIMAIGGSRFAWRQIRRHLHSVNDRRENGDRANVIIYGAARSGFCLAQHTDMSSDPDHRIIGFVDDDTLLQGMIIAGYRVLGSGEDLPRLVARYEIDQVILAAPSASGDQLKRMYDNVRQSDAGVLTLPRMLERVSEEVRIDDLRSLRYEDLLGRDMTDIDLTLDPNYIEGRTVLVTGAGGSIGSEICRQLCRYHPRQIILLGRGENRIHSIYRELLAEFPEIELTHCICNFTNEDHVRQVFARHQPEVVFHAGAHKHVYLMEDDPAEAVRNNVVGTGIVAMTAADHGVERFVTISTDKAVEPCNVMGASKRLSEILMTKLDPAYDTKFTAVRFGNVIGSSGSVLTIFQRQSALGRPLTVTHPEATRFFMTVEEAAFLVLHAGALGEGGEIFVLEMGEPVCIYDMACEFLTLNGRDPDAPGSIEITELRPGEKLHEKLYSSREQLEETACLRINRVRTNGELQIPWSAEELLSRARQATNDHAAAQALLASVCASQTSSAELLTAGGE